MYLKAQFYTAHSDLHDGKYVCVHVAHQNAQFEPMITLSIVKWASLEISFSFNMSSGAMTSWTSGKVPIQILGVYSLVFVFVFCLVL